MKRNNCDDKLMSYYYFSSFKLQIEYSSVLIVFNSILMRTIFNILLSIYWLNLINPITFIYLFKSTPYISPFTSMWKVVKINMVNPDLM